MPDPILVIEFNLFELVSSITVIICLIIAAFHRGRLVALREFREDYQKLFLPEMTKAVRQAEDQKPGYDDGQGGHQLQKIAQGEGWRFNIASFRFILRGVVFWIWIRRIFFFIRQFV